MGHFYTHTEAVMGVAMFGGLVLFFLVVLVFAILHEENE
jgi:hypothetical protein